MKFGKGAKTGAQKIVVTSTSTGITKDQAVKALGTKSSKYVVTAWTEPAAADAEEEGDS